MPFLDSSILDFGLNHLSTLESLTLHVCSQEPRTYAKVLGWSLGEKPDINISEPKDMLPLGRTVTVGPIEDGYITSTDPHVAIVALYWALVHDGKLLASGPIEGMEVFNSINRFNLSAFDIGFAAPV